MFAWRSAAPLLAIAFLVQSPPPDQRVPDITIEGLDPVRLTAGEEVQGRMEFQADHEGLRYLFADSDSRATFLKAPARYAVQLGGICARMGPIREVYSSNPPVNGPPVRTGIHENWAVHDGRIYLFATMECRKAFLADPAPYLMPPTAPLPTDQASVDRARELIAKAVEAIGGGAAVDGVTSYASVGSQVMATPDGEAPGTVTVQWTDDDRARIERQNGPFTMVAAVNPEGGFLRATRGGAVLLLERMLAAQRAYYDRTLRYHQDILGILKARSSAAFTAARVGAPPGAAPGIEHVGIRIGDAAMTLGIEPSSGRARTLSFTGRTSHGFVGTRTLTFDDYRPVDGLTLPHKVSARFNGKPDPEWTWTVTGIQLNEPIDPALFRAK